MDEILDEELNQEQEGLLPARTNSWGAKPVGSVLDHKEELPESPASCVIEECDRKDQLKTESIHWFIDVKMLEVATAVQEIKERQTIKEYKNGVEINRLLNEMMLIVNRISKLTQVEEGPF